MSEEPIIDPQAPTPAPAPSGDPQHDPVEMARRLGELEKVEKDYKQYREQIDPIIETLYADQEVLTTVQKAHNKRLGVAIPGEPSPDPENPAPAPVKDKDSRDAMIIQIQTNFERSAGIDKLEPEKQKEARAKIGQYLKEFLDPNNNKTISQVFDDVSLVKLPFYLENSWKIINRDNEIIAAKEEGRNEVLNEYQSGAGQIGSMPSGSISTDQVTLTPLEKQIAAKQGLSEADYLEEKKKIIQSKG